MKSFILSGLAVLFACFAGVSEVSACSCSAAPTVLDDFNASPIVVTARLEELEELDRSVEAGNVYRTVAAVMTVEKVYKGTLKTSQRIRILDGSGGDCSMGFLRPKPGQRFLFFTTPAKQIGKLNGRLHWISRCSRSERIEAAGPDLAYLDNRTKLAGKTRLSGTVKRFSQEPSSLGNIRVSVTGKNFQQVVATDEVGFFELWGLPAGQYRVAFDVPRGTRIRDYKIVPLDKTWRRQAPPENAVQASIGVRQHTEIIVGLDAEPSGGN
jgi:hypothetical protein